MSDPVDAYLAGLAPEVRAAVDALREIVIDAAPQLTERIKWNAPSFAVGDEDRITLGIERKGGVRVVLHRGAKAKDSQGFAFADPAELATWPASDRGVLIFADADEVEVKRELLAVLFARWIAATSELTKLSRAGPGSLSGHSGITGPACRGEALE